MRRIKIDRDGPTSNPGVEMARSIRPLVLENAEASERERTLNKETVDALWQSGLLQYTNPREAGGVEPSVPEMLEIWEELAWQDGSVGWIGIANLPSAAFAAAYLPDEGFAEVFTANDHRITMGGQFAPNGQGQVREGGYSVTGKWNFGSGTGHSEYVAGGFIPFRDGAPLMGDDGLPDLRVAIFPRDEIRFTDGWYVTGLKATGSFDYEVEDVFVPEHRTYPLFTREPRRGGNVFRLGIMPITGAGHGAWAVGVARSCLDDVMTLAQSTQRMGEASNLANKMTFQAGLAHHEGMWRAAWSLLQNTHESVWESVGKGGELTLEMRADMRVAATYATQASREIVHWAHLAAGTTAIREGCRLERAFRDMYTGTQHTFIGEKTYIDSANVMLGLADALPGL
ncbi:MAG: acyl-CoA dehydrogenase [bacterium]|nr:acyl-CoA dehydrogenase [Deltaproteobacteria bacterium]MCP4905333.1 acyl-CoA dehydrogenase [bacterium]